MIITGSFLPYIRVYVSKRVVVDVYKNVSRKKIYTEIISTKKKLIKNVGLKLITHGFDNFCGSFHRASYTIS